MSAAAADGAAGSVADEQSSSAAPAANGAVSAPSANHHHQHQQHDRLISAADVPQDVAPTVAEYVRSYSQLEALIDAHPTQFTAAVLLPILIRLLAVVVDAIFGPLVEVPIPQLTQSVSIIVAATRRLFMLTRGGDWARWRPHLEMLYLLQGNRPLVLGDDNFGIFGSRAAFIGETEAVRQWKMLSWGVTVAVRGQGRQLMNGNGILDRQNGRSVPPLMASASPVFPHVPFDPADPPTELSAFDALGLTCPNYTSMAGRVLFSWLFGGDHIRRIKSWCSDSPASAAFQRVCELLSAPPSDAAQWGAGVFDKKRPCSDREGHRRLMVLGIETMGDGHMAVIELIQLEFIRQSPRYVVIWTTESAPHDKTCTVVMRVLGDHLGGKVWREENEEKEHRRATANTRRCTIM